MATFLMEEAFRRNVLELLTPSRNTNLLTILATCVLALLTPHTRTGWSLLTILALCVLALLAPHIPTWWTLALLTLLTWRPLLTLLTRRALLTLLTFRPLLTLLTLLSLRPRLTLRPLLPMFIGYALTLHARAGVLIYQLAQTSTAPPC